MSVALGWLAMRRDDCGPIVRGKKRSSALDLSDGRHARLTRSGWHGAATPIRSLP